RGSRLTLKYPHQTSGISIHLLYILAILSDSYHSFMLYQVEGGEFFLFIKAGNSYITFKIISIKDKSSCASSCFIITISWVASLPFFRIWSTQSLASGGT